MMLRKALLYLVLPLVCAAVPLHAADSAKVLRVAFQVDVTGFDPQAAADGYSIRISRAIFDSLLQYDFLNRPYVLAPSTADLPEIKDGGRTFVFRLKKGIYFTPDPVFKGKPRELIAEDYVYSWKRLLDPQLAAPWSLLVNGKFVGADAVVSRARASGKFDYDAKIEGLQALDRYTLQVKLQQPDYILIENMTTTPMAAVAREVIEAYGDPKTGRTMDHPVGTGAYVLKDWRRGSKLTLAANPGYREEFYPASTDPNESAAVRANAGKRLPMIGQIDVSIIEESNPRLLAFNSHQIDYLHLPLDLTTSVLDNGVLKPEYAAQHVVFSRILEPAFFYTYFNMDDAVVGGYTPEKIALRRAIAMAYNVTDEIRIIRQGQAIPANQPMSPGLLGHDPNAPRLNAYDPAAARALLERFGYKDRDGDGYRELSDGRPLVLQKGSTTDTEGRLFDEVWKKSMDAIGIKVEFVKQKWPELLKMSQAGKLQMWTLGRGNAVRDGGVNLEVLASKNIANTMNDSHFSLPDYDRLFERALLLPDSPERTALYRKMSDLAGAYAPMVLGVYRYENLVVYPWVLGFKHNAFIVHPWKYMDIDLARRNAQ